MSSEYYEDTRFCDNCDRYTKHRCKDTGHERDSSWDYQECLVCHWYAMGIDGFRYTKPSGWVDDDYFFDKKED